MPLIQTKGFMENNIWSEFAQSYDKVIPELNCYMAMLNKILRHAEGSQLVIDAGCGTGLVSRELVERKATVFAFDNNAQMLAEAFKKRNALQRDAQTWQILPGDVVKFPQETPHNADVVIFNNVLFFVAEPELALKEAFAHLKDGGVLIATGPRKRPDAVAVMDRAREEWVNESRYTPDLIRSVEHFEGLSKRLTKHEMVSFLNPKSLWLN